MPTILSPPQTKRERKRVVCLATRRPKCMSCLGCECLVTDDVMDDADDKHDFCFERGELD
jgi:hypothetical protein